MDGNITELGGFLAASLPSPAPSNVSHSSTISNLPHPRSHPLKAGSAKEEAARRFVENRLLHISRRYTKKFQPHRKGEIVHGYVSMSEVSKDLGEVVDILWLSGTPSLQVPYLLNIALSVSSYLPAFPAAPKATFALLRKLDHAFSSLLKGEDSATGEVLPGFQEARGMSRTDMVRCKSLVEGTRVVVVEVMNKETEMENEPVPIDESGGESDDMNEMGSEWDIDEDDHNMDIAKVYESTITTLGELLVGGTVYDSGSGQS